MLVSSPIVAAVLLSHERTFGHEAVSFSFLQQEAVESTEAEVSVGAERLEAHLPAGAPRGPDRDVKLKRASGVDASANLNASIQNATAQLHEFFRSRPSLLNGTGVEVAAVVPEPETR